MNAETRSVQIPVDLYAEAQNKFGQRFASVDELVTFALRELVRDDAAQMDEAERRLVEERLRDLGYL
jgi:Arc/MetJ-type ribon-helix-helix transcriptional regulator